MNGQVVDETQTDWLHLPRLGRKELRLYCPNRDVAVVGGTENNNGLRVGDNSGLLFQLKGATMRVGIGTETDFHMIGIVYGTNGECKFWVWDCHTKRLLGPLDDNRYAMKFANIGELSARHLGLEE